MMYKAKGHLLLHPIMKEEYYLDDKDEGIDQITGYHKMMPNDIALFFFKFKDLEPPLQTLPYKKDLNF